MYARLFIIVNRSKSTPVVMEGVCGLPVRVVSLLLPLMKNKKISNTSLLYGLKIDASWSVGKCWVCPWLPLGCSKRCKGVAELQLKK